MGLITDPVLRQLADSTIGAATPCHICGKLTRKRPRSGRYRYRHKCPHGRWCVAGDRVLGHHANNVQIGGSTRCAACALEAFARRLRAAPPLAEDL